MTGVALCTSDVRLTVPYIIAKVLKAPGGVKLVETNTGQPIEPDAVVAEFVEAVKPFTRRADYIALNLNCPSYNSQGSLIRGYWTDVRGVCYRGSMWLEPAVY